MEGYEQIEIPPIELPDEVTHTNRPEIEITSPHPVVPSPGAGATAESTGSRPIGFLVEQE